MQNIFHSFLIAMLVFCAGCSRAHGTKMHGAEKLRVGLVLPLTGNAAFYGKDALDAALLWKEDHPNAPLELKVEDGELEAVRSLHAALKLTQLDKVNALFTMDANTGRAIKRVADQYGVIQIC